MGDWVGDGVALGGGDKKFQSSRFQKKARSDLMKNPNLQKNADYL